MQIASIFLVLHLGNSTTPDIVIPFHTMVECSSVRQQFLPHFSNPDNIVCVSLKDYEDERK